MAPLKFTYGVGRLNQAQVTTVFETPLIVRELDDAPSLNASLKAAVLRRRQEDVGLSVSNIGGWHSDTRMVLWGGAPAKTLLDQIIATADEFTVDLKAKGVARYRWHPEMWANVSPHGASNRHHCHPGAFWSAVYYVDDGYGGSSDPELGGELVLFDPRMPMIRMNAPDLRFRKPGAPPDHDEAKMRPTSGRLVIFPSWLNHAVLPYNGDQERVSIAVNLTAVPRPTERE